MKLHIFEENSRYGYRDENEAIVIPAKYEEVKDFKEDHAVVKYNGSYGVINSSDELVIDYAYTSIEEQNLFFECETIQEHEPKEKTLWYNWNGMFLHEGKANVLSERHLCISNGKKFGVIDKEGNRIINCLYDEIVLQKELFIVRRDDKLGLYDLSGNVILDVFCKSIESVVIDNNPMLLGTTTFPNNQEANHYPGYCKEFYFDTNNTHTTISPYVHFWCGTCLDLLYREAVIVTSKWKVYNINEEYNPEYFIESVQTIQDITKPMIISTGASKMIFTRSEGILPNSEFDDIQQITQICYVVKKDNLFGVYRIDTQNIIVPIEYESIRFFGGHTVLVCKDGLWGAKSIVLSTSVFNIIFKVTIPTKYLEIDILDDAQLYFGCKKKEYHSSEAYYTLVRSNGEEIEDINELECDKQFVYIDSSHFMTSIGGKFGFINSQGQKVIPFKYDEITAREDGRFDVRLNNRWGILTIDGFEIVRIKYSSPLPKQFDKEIIVKDAESECFGLLAPDGSEIIPTVYEHILGSEDDELYYFGCGGFEDEDHPTFFSGDINGALWGVVNRSGKRLIDAKYLNLKIQSGYIVAGRDGHYFPDDDNDDYNWYGSNFNGVYDLYNKDGELLIGGFREFEYDEKNRVFIFFFGGEWKEYSAFDDDWNNIHITGYKFERGIDLWLILDKDFKTILRDKNGNPKQFEKGFIGKIEIKKEDNKIKHVYNMPIELMAKGFSHVAINSIIINDSNSEYHKSQAVDIKTGKKTKMYTKIEQITESFFFFADSNKVGICSIDNIEFEDCLFITYPVNNHIIIAKKQSEETCNVSLYSINDRIELVSSVITSISFEEVIHLAKGNWLKIVKNDSFTGLKALTIPNSRFLDKTVLDIVSTREGTDYVLFSHNKENNYFFSNDYRLLPENNSHNDGSFYENNDNYSIMDALDGDPDAYWNID